MNAPTPVAPDVRVAHGQIITTSLNIAQVFGKQHKNVLDAIKRLDCSEEFARLNFQPCSYLDANNRNRPLYEITRDGFTFLAMGFTGKEAARFKEAYIQAFNRLAEELAGIRRELALPAPETLTLTKNDYIALQAERIDLLKAKIELLELKATSQPRRRPFTDDEKAAMLALHAEGRTPREIADELDRSQNSVEGFLRQARRQGGAQ
jgi:Rha family phage regulatory protein